MVYPISLTEFIEKQMTFYQIENNEKNFGKIYKKCQRTLTSLGFWEKAETRIVKKSKTKFFNENEIKSNHKEVQLTNIPITNANKDFIDQIPQIWYDKDLELFFETIE